VRNDIPWQEVRARYERGEGSYRTLAEEYGVARSTMERRALVENWGGRRRTDSADRARECLYSAARQLLQCVEELLMRPQQPPAAREIREMTAVLRELMQFRQSLEEESCGGEAPELRVVLEGEIESWAE